MTTLTLTEGLKSYTIFFHDGGRIVLKEVLNALNEQKQISFGGRYSAVKHQPHNSTGQYHIHVSDGNNEIFALNVDGSAHDKSHGVRIPNKVAIEIKKRFPNFKLPENGIIESFKKNDYFIAFGNSKIKIKPFRSWVLGNLLKS